MLSAASLNLGQSQKDVLPEWVKGYLFYYTTLPVAKVGLSVDNEHDLLSRGREIKLDFRYSIHH